MARRLRIAFPSGLSYTLIANAGTFTTTGQDATFVVGSVVLATLTGSTVAAPTVGQTYTVTLSAPAAVAYTITWANASGAAVNATFSVPTSVIGVGQTTASVVVTWPTAGVGGVDFTISPAVTRAGRPIGVTVGTSSAQDFGTTVSASSVVWFQDFERTQEVTAFNQNADPESLGAKLVLEQDSGIWCLRQRVLGGELAAPFTAGGSTMVINGAEDWPDPAIDGEFRFQVSRAYPGPPDKNLFRCTARNGTTLSVVRETFFGGTALNATAQSYAIGDYAGQECPTWIRDFSALPLGENGKLVHDSGAAGAVPIRSKIGTAPFNVPSDSIGWNYGYYGHPDNQTTWANWTPWVNATTYTPLGIQNGAADKFRLWDGQEFYIRFAFKLDPDFYTFNPSLPTPSTAGNWRWGRKTWGIQTRKSNPSQLVAGQASATQFSIPSTLDKAPFVLQTYKAGRTIGEDDYVRPVGTNSYQKGSPWDVAPYFARLTTSNLPSTGAPTPDGSAAWEPPAGEWIEMLVRVKPGRSGLQDTEVEVKFARPFDASYSGNWTTALNVTDARIFFGNGNDIDYPNGAFNSSTISMMDQLPGYSAFLLFGYLNIFQGPFPVPPRRSYDFKLGRVVFSRSAIAPPKPMTLPSYVPSPGSVAQIVQGGGVLLNNFRSTVAPYYDEVEATKAFDFSSSVINPYWGQYGAMIHYGGGHASTNYNGLHCLEFGASTINWRCLINGSPFAGTGTDATTRWDNNRQNITMDSTYKEVFVGGVQQVGRPASPHTYDARDIIGPALGGGAHGSLILIARAENSYAGANPVVAAHKVDFDTTTGATDSYVWERVANVPFVGASGEPPYSARVAPDQGRIYFEAGKASHTPIYLDLATRAYATTTGTGKTVSVGGNGVSLILVQERGLQLYLGQDGSPTNGKLQIQYRRCGANDTTVGWSTLRTLSANIPINGNPITATWCPDIQRLLVGCVHGDYDCVYEIEIPTNLDAAWQCTRRALPANAIDWSGKEAGFTGNAGWPYGGWNPKLRCWVIFRPSSSGADRVFLYRPLGT